MYGTQRRDFCYDRDVSTSPEEQRLKLTIAYNGARFRGWQKGNGRTVQDTLIAAIAESLPDVPVAEIRVDGAGRTDAGVHATGQVASVVLPRGVDPDQLLRRVNGNLPEDVAVSAVEPADDRFHARYHAVSRSYRYTIVDGQVGDPFLRGLAWRYPDHLDREALTAAARVLTGTHDFAAFTADRQRANTVRTVHSIDITRREPPATLSELRPSPRPSPHPSTLPEPRPSPADQAQHPLDIMIRGDSFLWRQVRIMVGALVQVGEGKLTPENLQEILASRDRSRAPAPAPAWGLTLVSVEYAP